MHSLITNTCCLRFVKTLADPATNILKFQPVMYMDGMYLDGTSRPVQLDVRMSSSRQSGWDGFGVFVGRPDNPDILIQIRVFWCASGDWRRRSTLLSPPTCLRSPLTRESASARRHRGCHGLVAQSHCPRDLIARDPTARDRRQLLPIRSILYSTLPKHQDIRIWIRTSGRPVTPNKRDGILGIFSVHPVLIHHCVTPCSVIQPLLKFL